MIDRRKPDSGPTRRERPTTSDGSKYCFNLFDEVPTTAPETRLDQALDQRRHRRAEIKTNADPAENTPSKND